MPANLTPEYFKADKWFRSASTNEEKILALEEMLRVIPKHKGTDHMRADLRKKLSKLKDVQGKKSGGSKGVDIFHVPKSGAGQIVLIGLPNSGKSAIVGALTNAKVSVADFPYATSAPVPGMAAFEDIQFQLVDMPPITAEVSAPGQVGTYRNCDLIGIVINLSANIDEQFEVCLEYLESRKLLIDNETKTEDERGNRMAKEAFVLCTKSDLAKPGAIEEVKSICKGRFEIIETSVENLQGIEELGGRLFNMLGIIRIYSKKPGQKADMTDPFTLPKGSTVMDLANAIHRQLAEKLKNARIWGQGVHDGQNIQRTHVLEDKNVVELHFN